MWQVVVNNYVPLVIQGKAIRLNIIEKDFFSPTPLSEDDDSGGDSSISLKTPEGREITASNWL